MTPVAPVLIHVLHTAPLPRRDGIPREQVGFDFGAAPMAATGVTFGPAEKPRLGSSRPG